MEPVLPLRAIIFQSLFLLVAIILEAAVFRRKLLLDHKTSAQYAATVNLLTTSLGWILFLSLLPLVPEEVQTQIMSYIFFGNFYASDGQGGMGVWIAVSGLVIFFGSFLVKLKGLELLMRILNKPRQDIQVSEPTRQEKYQRARATGRLYVPISPFSTAILRANAVSFSAITLLLLLMHLALTTLGSFSNPSP